MHLYSLPSWAFPKTGRVLCGRKVSSKLMVADERYVTCPHCTAILESNKKALAAVKAEHAAGRHLNMSQEALDIVKESNLIFAKNYQGKVLS